MENDQATPERIEHFRATLEADQIEKLLRQGYGSQIEAVRCKIKMGRKYANVDVGDSGKYMVELATSRIYGINIRVFAAHLDLTTDGLDL